MSEEKPTPQEIADGIRKIKALIDKPEKWTKGSLAKNRRGITNPHSKSATCFCITGATIRCFPTSKTAPITYALAYALAYVPVVREIVTIFANQSKRRGFRLVYEFNDSAGVEHSDIMTFLDDSIAQAERLEG